MRAILTFHSIDDSGSILSYPISAFSRLMTSIANSRIPVIELDRIWSSPCGIVITFDDGMQSVRKSALPVLRDLGFPSHLFLATGVVGGDNYWPTQPASAPRMPMLSWDDVEQCRQAGMHIESHTHRHPDLRTLTESEIEQECATANNEIMAHTGRKPRHFAYPYGYLDDRVAAIISKQYEFAVTTKMAFVDKDRHAAEKLPRLDTYYFKSPLVSSNPFGPVSRSYLMLRRLLREVRETMS